MEGKLRGGNLDEPSELDICNTYLRQLRVVQYTTEGDILWSDLERLREIRKEYDP